LANDETTVMEQSIVEIHDSAAQVQEL